MKIPLLLTDFKSIREKLTFSFFVTTINILIIIGIFIWFNYQAQSIRHLTDTLNGIAFDIERANNLEKDFYNEDAINPDFYESGESPYVEEHQRILADIQGKLVELKTSDELEELEIGNAIDSTVLDIGLFELYFDSLVIAISARGFESYGYEGKIRRSIGRVINSGVPLDQERLLTMRLYEKDYLLRQDSTTRELLFEEIEKFSNSLPPPRNRIEELERSNLEGALKEYKDSFQKLTELDGFIGNQQEGLFGWLARLSDETEARIQRINRKITLDLETTRTNIIIAIAALLLLFLVLNFSLSQITIRDLSKPLENLSSSIHQAVESNFDEKVKVYHVEREDEIGLLSNDFEFMLKNVRSRTREVLYQKEQINSAYQNVQQLAKIGQEMTASLVIDEITDTALRSLNGLMEFNTFSLGIYQEKEKKLYFKKVSADGKHHETVQAVDERKHLGAYTFMRQEEVVINCRPDDHKKLAIYPSELIENTSLPAVSIPLTSKGRKLGVLIVRPADQKLFSEFEIDMIRNLAVYAVIALDNASVYENLEDTVRERTEEVVSQKEELERSKTELERAYQDIQLLSEIGQIVMSYLSVSTIIKKVYEQVGNLMDVAVFGIGIYREESNSLVFDGSIENGVELETYSYSLTEEDSLSIQCFGKNKEILVNHLKERTSSASHLETASGETPKSLVYLPIMVQGRTIGVLSVHSLKENAYSENHIKLLRNVAIYAGIALENADNYEQIETQKKEIETTSRKLHSSINYAKRIQEAMLPDRQSIKQALPESFILFKPRDMVSGDFFWFAEQDDKQFVAAVDCTGHGVPGALMSMIGNELLNEVINLRNIHEPSQILRELHYGVRQDLKQRDTQNADGMDMVICVIDKKAKELSFAGAKNPLVYIQNGDLHYIKGDRFPIGGKQLGSVRNYTTHKISFHAPTTFYLYSDGYQDQFGGEKGTKKFMAPRFRNLLHNIHFLPMSEQEEILDTTIKKWMRGSRQIDDILVMGFAL
ncbi:MAG: GAF domain-containing protein [Bacteroidota bacterium]